MFCRAVLGFDWHAEAVAAQERCKQRETKQDDPVCFLYA